MCGQRYQTRSLIKRLIKVKGFLKRVVRKEGSVQCYLTASLQRLTAKVRTPCGVRLSEWAQGIMGPL